MTGAADPVARYAQRFHAAAPGHHVVSPLGAWLLLALLAPAAGPVAQQRVEDALGTDAGTARAAVDALLAAAHPAVSSALALWTARWVTDRPRYDAWAAGLPEALARGPLPDQAALDTWAREVTDGLVERFPVAVDELTAAVLASALATRRRWAEPFGVCPSSRLGGPWAGQVGRALAAPGSHRVAVVAGGPGEPGLLGVHAVRTEDGDLDVVSVVAAPDVDRADVLRAAYRVAVATASAGYAVPDAVDPFDLPLGEGPAWTVEERTGRVMSPDGRESAVSAVLPAWDARTDLDLLVPDDALGFGAAGSVLVDLLAPIDAPRVEARQSAVARYTAAGFEAAAVTAVAVAAGAMLAERTGRIRRVDVRFAHPYAVVAVARQVDGVGGAGPMSTGPWHGLPVFGAWVADPAEAHEPEWVEPEWVRRPH